MTFLTTTTTAFLVFFSTLAVTLISGQNVEMESDLIVDYGIQGLAPFRYGDCIALKHKGTGNPALKVMTDYAGMSCTFFTDEECKQPPKNPTDQLALPVPTVSETPLPENRLYKSFVCR